MVKAAPGAISLFTLLTSLFSSVMFTQDTHNPAWPEEEEPVPPSEEIGRLVQQGRFCEAARLYSDWSGADYLDSKLAIDRLAHKHGLAPRSGCASYLMAMLVGIGMGVWCLVG